MNKPLILTFISLLVLNLAVAQMKYPVSAIPSELKTRANAVIRDMETKIEIKDLENVVQYTKKAVTILNKNGENEAKMMIWYDKTRNIRYIKAQVYNEFGLPAGKIPEKEFQDVSAANDYSLF
jgi:hypothetical protein